MAKFSAYHRLCPLIDSKTLGVTDESVNGCVIITLGRNMVIRYKLSDQKQVSSWSSKDKLSAPVFYDSVSKLYIGVFNSNQISTWEESCLQLNKIKKYKFTSPIECVITSPNSSNPVVVFRKGYILPLHLALERRKENLPEKLTNNDTICEAHLITVMGIEMVILFTVDLQENHSVHLIPLEEGLYSQTHIEMKRTADDSNVRLISYALINFENCQLLTLWSDGQLFRLELPTSDSEQFPGKYVTTITAINLQHKAGILPLSSTHLAIYGADKNDEGALLFILNLELGVTQCKQTFKMFSTPARLWAGSNSCILMADNQYLLVVPYYLGQQRLTGLVCSQESEQQTLQKVEWVVPVCQEQSGNTHPTPEDKMIQSYMQEGISEGMMCQNLFLPLLDAKDINGLKHLMNNVADVPESCIIDVVSMCLKNIKQSGMRELLLTTLDMPITSNLGILRLLRLKINLPLVLILLQEVRDAMLEKPHNLKLIEWATLLLDSYYQQYLLSRNKEILQILNELKAVVEKELEDIIVWQQLGSILEQLQNKQDLPDSAPHSNTSYCVEQITLY